MPRITCRFRLDTSTLGKVTISFDVVNRGEKNKYLVPQLFANNETSSLTVHQWQLQGF